MIWCIKHANILDEPADVLICSANPWLNLSGGVGGEILARYGPLMQQELHAVLAERGVRAVAQGTVVQTSACGTPFRAVLHAVAIDAFYQSSPPVITKLVADGLHQAASLQASKVALTALATGYGRLSMQSFGEALAPLLDTEFPPLEEVTVCVRKVDARDALAASLPGALTT
jgi:O-acetyl-ADP-ribose deacetylase (regulator of RNase III)